MRILVTGAAGLLGGDVCARLHAAGHEVTGLVHRNPSICGNDGRLVPIASLSGDVSKRHFGWDEENFAKCADAHDLLVHCAATVRFDLAEEDYHAVNIAGVENALDLAGAGEMDFLHVSTAYVCGARDGMIRENDSLPENGFANGYESSKAKGEQLVRASDLRWVIARPSIIVGEYESGAIRQFDTTYAAFKLIAEGHVRHMPAKSGATLDFVPLDYVAGGVTTLAGAMSAAARGTFHLVSGQPLPIETFTGTIGAYPQFREPELVPRDSFDPTRLSALERRLFKRVAGLYASYFQRNPHFDDREFRKLVSKRCPPTGEDFIRRLIDHCIVVGFLAEP